jgi:hypothetical protein
MLWSNQCKLVGVGFWCLTPLSKNISVISVEETGVPGENDQTYRKSLTNM